MSDFDWILRSERAKTRKPKGQYLYEEYEDKTPVKGVEYDWRNKHQSNIEVTSKSKGEPRIDFQGKTYEELNNSE